MEIKPFHFQNGKLFCENIQIESFINSLATGAHHNSIQGKLITTEVPPTPAFVYSATALKRNVQDYLEGMKNAGLQSGLGYAVKANSNLHILQSLLSYGVEMLVTVSGNEILASLAAGCQPENIIFNGNGKQVWEIKLAIEQGVMLNVDSVFDAENISSISKNCFPNKEVKVLLRIRPSPFQCNITVHPYVNTSESSKFGFDILKLDEVLDVLESGENINIYGIHCHLGSSIYDTGVFASVATIVSDVASTLEKKGIRIEILNVGGGIGINYHSTLPGMEPFLKEIDSLKDHSSSNGIDFNIMEEKNIPSISQFMEYISPCVNKNTKIVVEPGRSLVANAGILVSKVLGSKYAGTTNYMVVDSSMAEIIRPCLYEAHHQIYPTTLETGKNWSTFDVVGPICETADFLGKDIPLQGMTNYLAVMDCGAYCASMSSNYNMRPRPTEILMDKDSWRCIRQRDAFEDIISQYNFSL